MIMDHWEGHTWITSGVIVGFVVIPDSDVVIVDFGVPPDFGVDIVIVEASLHLMWEHFDVSVTCLAKQKSLPVCLCRRNLLPLHFGLVKARLTTVYCCSSLFVTICPLHWSS